MARTRTIKRSRRKKAPRLPFLPDSAQAFLARRLVDIAAALLCVAGVFILLALLSYDHTDPSWNTSGSGEGISNRAGLPGAWSADLLLQTLGLGAFVPGLVLLSWGARAFRRESLSPFWARIVSMLAASVFTAIALGVVPSGGWIVHPYLGSSAGTMILDQIVSWGQGLSSGLEHGA